MRLKDCVVVNKNKRNNQVSFSLQKNKLKVVELKIDDVLNAQIPLNKKFADFDKY